MIHYRRDYKPRLSISAAEEKPFRRGGERAKKAGPGGKRERRDPRYKILPHLPLFSSHLS